MINFFIKIKIIFENGTTSLKEISEVDTDKFTTICVTRLSDKIGKLAEKEPK